MGDSSVSCALSGLTLHGEPVVFIPLAPSEYAEKLIGARIVSMGPQACALFSPMTLPLRGKVDDYGRLVNIAQDVNTALISAAFGLSIEAFAAACIEGDPLDSGDSRFSGCGCFIHAEVYDRFSRPLTGGKYAGTMWAATFARSQHLEAIGCELVGKHPGHYRHPSIPGVNFHAAGRSTVTTITNEGEQLYGHSLRDLQQALRSAGLPLFPPQDVARVKAIPEVPEQFRLQSQAMLNPASRGGLMIRSSLHLFDGLRLLDCVPSPLLESYIENFADGRLLPLAERLFYILWAFGYANRALMPTITGTQLPEHEITAIMTSFVNDLAKQRLKGRH